MLAGCLRKSSANEGQGFWPQGKEYCVTLTYDDALQSQIDNALPQLKAADLKGTFFFAGGPSRDWSQEDVNQVRADGHEFAAHTLLHPCSRSFDFVPEGDALEDYDEARMAQELDKNIANLIANGVNKENITFAYPCGQTFVGEDKRSFIPLIQERFIAARGTRPDLAIPGQIDFDNVPSIPAHEGGLDAQLAWLNRAREQSAWAVYMFHGIGGDYLSIDADAHQTLLATLNQAPTVWVTTFAEATAWLKKRQVLS